jgi:hypothetical protein
MVELISISSIIKVVGMHTVYTVLEGVPDLVNGITLNEALQSEWIESLSDEDKSKVFKVLRTPPGL